LFIAQHPQNNITNLFNLVPGSPAFSTGLSSSPPDWTLAIQYTDPTNSSLNNTVGSAVDANGNIWVANAGSSMVTEITPGSGSVGSTIAAASVQSYPSGGFTQVPNALAVDSSGNVWVAAGTTSAALYELASGSYSSVARTCTNANLATPNSVSIDTGGNVWVSNGTGNSVVMFASNCSGSSGTNYTGLGGLGTPVAIAAGAH
jgi:sugar lactone lactonase YvrE